MANRISSNLDSELTSDYGSEESLKLEDEDDSCYKSVRSKLDKTSFQNKKHESVLSKQETSSFLNHKHESQVISKTESRLFQNNKRERHQTPTSENIENNEFERVRHFRTVTWRLYKNLTRMKATSYSKNEKNNDSGLEPHNARTEVELGTKGAVQTIQDILYKAIKKQNFEQISICLDGCDPLLENSDGISPFSLSLQSQNPNVMQELGRKIRQQFINENQKQLKTVLQRVWIGYIAHEKNKIINIGDVRIIAILRRHLDSFLPSTFRNIGIYWRQNEEVSKEAKEIIRYEKILHNREITGEDAKQLFNAHSQLSIIHVSGVKSTKFATFQNKITSKKCVALYCQVKGIIPLGEGEFPTMIRSLPTDVREGYAVFGMGESLKPGTAIYCPYTGISGSIGGFVENPGGNIMLMTAAHLVSKCEDLEKSEADKNFHFESRQIQISRGSVPYDVVGNVIKGCFQNSDPGECSIDAALAKVDRLLIASNFTFPSTDKDEDVLRLQGFTNITLPKIHENKILSLKEVEENSHADILKYGAVTKLTTGKLAVNGVHVRLDTGTLRAGDYDQYGRETKLQDFQFYHQIGVKNIGESSFFEQGDSGSFCYMIDNDSRNTIRPFGMAIGLSNGFCIVTPLENIFRTLGLDLRNGFKLFPLSTSKGRNGRAKQDSPDQQTLEIKKNVFHNYV